MIARQVHWLRVRLREFLVDLDEGKIRSYQTMYYVLITVAGVNLMFVADEPPQMLQDSLGPQYYAAWLVLNLVCPPMALFGRWITSRAAKKPPGQPNSAYGAAVLQLAGDGGVWGAIIVYVACVINTTWWGQGLYGAFFVLMGVPGGFMFALRSARRLLQIKRRERRMMP